MNRALHMVVAAIVGLWLFATPGHAQVPCDALALPLNDCDTKFIDDVLLPLVRADQNGLGPVLWTYIAGQARAESGCESKPGNNLWNVQRDFTKDCIDATIDGCLSHNQTKPRAPSKHPKPDTSKGFCPIFSDPCWSDGKTLLQWVCICFARYGSVLEAGRGYLEFKPAYTTKLKALAARRDRSLDSFLKELNNANWSSRARIDRAGYQDETRNNIREVLGNVAGSRVATRSQLADVQREIKDWCAASGVGDEQQREALRKRQIDLLKRIADFNSICLPIGTSGAGDARDDAIDTCRRAPPPPMSSSGRIDDKAPQSSASGVGEPHYLRPEGGIVSTQAAAELWLLRSERGVQFQVRQQPWLASRSVATISALAARVGARRVGIYVEDGSVRVDGRPLRWEGEFFQYDLGDGHALGAWGRAGRPEVVAIMWADGSTLRAERHASWLDVEYQVMRGVDTSRDTGLVGGASSDGAGGLIGADGVRRDRAHTDALAAFVDSWRISAAESLFDYGRGQSAAAFDRRDFPQTPAAPTEQALADAREVCRQAGVAASDALEICAFDLAVTGEREFLRSHLRAFRVSAGLSSHAGPPPRPGPRVLGPASPGFGPDPARAEAVENGRVHEFALAAAQQRVFLIDIVKPDVRDLFLRMYDWSCAGERYSGRTPGFQLLDDHLRALSEPQPSCTGMYSVPIRPGRYYVVVRGANDGPPATVKLEAFHY